MFSFMKKQAQTVECKSTEIEAQDKQSLPEGCEVLLECDFAEVSGGAGATTNMLHMAL
jgi:hypothetical protein